MGAKQWVVRQVDQARQQALAQELAISPITASVLLGRGIMTTDQARGWLSPTGAPQHDPFFLPQMEQAVDRLHRAVTGGERVCVYSDYDVDGVSAASLYVTWFGGLGASIHHYVPHRVREGYGLNIPALERLARQGVTLLVTADCGTTSVREVEAANRLGLDVIVTDHHQVPADLPAALAILNPHRPDSTYPFRGLCSAGLAYKVAQAYAAKFRVDDQALEPLLDLVALATVADVVPLQEENRVFVRHGLALMERGARCGIRALKQGAGVRGPCTAGTVAFRLGPRINAAGRLDHADDAVRLLTTDSEVEARTLAERLEQLNRERQRLEEGILSDALAQCDPGTLPNGLVLWSRDWHLGVVGIVASRLVDRFHRPAIVMAVNDQGVGKGSARGVPGFDLYAALTQCQDLLEGYGGHPGAAGLTIREDRLPAFAERFAAVVAEWTGDRPSRPLLHVDAEVSLREVDARLVRELEQLHPFGAGNPEPTLAVRNLSVLAARLVGDNHLKMMVRHEGSPPFESIGFRMGSLDSLGLAGSPSLDLVFVPEFNRWNGLDRIQLRIRDVRASGMV